MSEQLKTNDRLMLAALNDIAGNRADSARRMLEAIRQAGTLDIARREIESIYATMDRVDVLIEEGFRRRMV
jgi:hypothetical protein